MLVIRLARHGRKNWPTYRLVLQEKDWAPMSKAIETLGNMDPHANPATLALKTERIKYWIEKGAQTSNTVHNLLVSQGIITGEKRRVVTGKKAVSAI
ncbi:MAG TPA: 30S ribosomal protein S16 [Candidatus Kerfeldbacteria bacterium]|nr:30S ribosomal protein S16 [Candidatus Kerfeldbacteria bacterium]